MEITDYHAKYFAHELTRKCPSEDIESLIPVLLDAQVDLNPHQIEAALFACQSPLSKGVILADEVGLGKTIEAGIVLSQKWAERKKKILIIVPSSLRKQWNRELLEKFFLPSVILEASFFNQEIKDGSKNPFDQDEIVIASYHFVRNKSAYAKLTRWDLVVVDEAHRLRNVYKEDNKIAKCLRETFLETPKILLTATPLQNSLMELYGLASFIDDYAFGDQESFKSQYARLTDNDEAYKELKARLAPICSRNLRRQVQEYVKYTKRVSLTEGFIPTDEEQKLYDLVSRYLQREELKALPEQGRQLVTIVLRKILASSTFAIAGALEKIMNRLKQALKDGKYEIGEELEEDVDGLDNEKDEWGDDGLEGSILPGEKEAVKREIKELEKYYDLAISIKENAKGDALLKALALGFEKAQSLGAEDKAIVFTESRRTQNYLLSLLNNSKEYSGKVILFNGSNNDAKSKEVYENWKVKNIGSNAITDSRTADMRSALVDYFKNEAKIMIATEAASEGINLQFCSLIVNYDLPWNPQRIEQRIGRCHRYGQKHDVVVINFLNKKNAADQRVLELLTKKFRLFEGVFGTSDEVLGSIESGVDFEKRVLEIYQKCRNEEEINRAFDKLQEEMSPEIDKGLKTAKQRLLENFDQEVTDKLRITDNRSRNYLNKTEEWLWNITRHKLHGYADFEPERYSFNLDNNHPFSYLDIPTGPYEMGSNTNEAHNYRLHHPLAQDIIERVLKEETPRASLVFKYDPPNTPKVSELGTLIGKSGYLILKKLTVESFDKEEHLIFSSLLSGAGNEELSTEQCIRLFSLPCSVDSFEEPFNIKETLESIYLLKKERLISGITKRNSNLFDDEINKLDIWAADKEKTLANKLKEMEKEIKDTKKRSLQSNRLPEKVALQKRVSNLEAKKDEEWKKYDKAKQEIQDQKDRLLENVESQMSQSVNEETIFEIKWELIG